LSLSATISNEDIDIRRSSRIQGNAAIESLKKQVVELQKKLSLRPPPTISTTSSRGVTNVDGSVSKTLEKDKRSKLSSEKKRPSNNQKEKAKQSQK
jgi:hypothetical protein